MLNKIKMVLKFVIMMGEMAQQVKDALTGMEGTFKKYFGKKVVNNRHNKRRAKIVKMRKEDLA